MQFLYNNILICKLGFVLRTGSQFNVLGYPKTHLYQLSNYIDSKFTLWISLTLIKNVKNEGLLVEEALLLVKMVHQNNITAIILFHPHI